MELFELVKELTHLEPKEALSRLEQRTDISSFSKNDAPYYLQPEGHIYQVVSYDYCFKNGDCITFTVKESCQPDTISETGVWDCYSAEKKSWYRFEHDEFVLHDTYRIERKDKPKPSQYS